jgi:DNA-binding MurR/RpiR family transcriptional regulator
LRLGDAAMNPALDIVAALRGLAENGGKSDRRIAAVVLAEPEFVTHASIARVAERAGVSEPTVTRFCRALDCEGIRDFKVRLAQALAISGRYLLPLKTEPGPAEQRVPGIIRANAVDAVETVCRAIDVEDLARAGQILAVSRMIRAFGSGGSSSMAATELESRLFRLGLAISACIDGEMQRMIAAVSDAGTTIVALSISGLVRPQIEAVTIARQYGARTLAFTAPGSPLAAAAEIVFPFQVEEGTNVFRPSPARYALLALVDMLAMVTAEQIGQPAMEGMRRMKHHVSRARNNDPRLPLGD